MGCISNLTKFRFIYTILLFLLSFSNVVSLEVGNKELFLVGGEMAYNPRVVNTIDMITRGAIGGRVGSISWRDINGSFYIFGGQVSETSLRSDLWRMIGGLWYNLAPVTVSELGNYQGTYVAVGRNGYPACRQGASHWIDPDNSLWVFGGTTVSLNGSISWPLNDLWRFRLENVDNRLTGIWTWMSGNRNTEQGNPRSDVPAARTNAVSWTYNNKYYLFSGKLANGTATNDVWMFDPQTRAWTQVNDNQEGSPDSYPFPRSGATLAYDSSFMWVFGGRRTDDSFLNDLWKYSPASGEWTLESFNSLSNGSYPRSPGLVGSPPARESGCAWIDSSGTFWLHSGFRSPVNDTNGIYYGDFWSVDLSINTKSFVWQGTSTTLDFPSTVNVTGSPGPRAYAACMQNEDSLYFLGGRTAFGSRNDIWLLDNNECAINNGGCTTNCTNFIGARVECSACPPGYGGDPYSNCTLSDVCGNNGGCDILTTCIAGTGLNNRTCSKCPRYYTGTGETGCIDINECVSNNGGCDPITNCTNRIGSPPVCGPCPPYYSGDSANGGCIDIDECAESNSACAALMVCNNVIGGPPRCTCPPGLSLTSCPGNSRSISAGVIAGVTIGGLAVLLTVIGLIFFFTKDKGKPSPSRSSISLEPNKFELTALSQA